MSVARWAKFGRSINFLASGDRVVGIVRFQITKLGIWIQGSRLISDATYPAPKPLSIFTTLTFDAHEFIIPNSAANPSNAAPYPTLVGTAITGTPTSPPITLGSAPSIPAQTITIRALISELRCANKR